MGNQYIQKLYLCRFCGEVNPEMFKANYKGICKRCQSDYGKKYRKSNIDSLKNKAKIYYIENKEKKSEYSKNYYLNNKEHILYTSKNYRRENKEKRNLYEKSRRDFDPSYKIISNLRIRQGKVLLGKMSTTKDLGCDSSFLRSYIESLWEPWMNWDNYGNKKGQWSIDHIFPLSMYEEDGNGDWDSNSEYNKLLVHYTNMRPLLHDDNLKKSNKVL